MTVLIFLAAAWLTIGSWLSIGGLRQVWPDIVADKHSLPFKAFGVFFAFIMGAVWLPVPFFIALYREIAR